MISLGFKKILKFLIHIIYVLTIFEISILWFYNIWIPTSPELFRYGKMNILLFILCVGFFYIVDRSLDGFKAFVYYVKDIVDKEYENQKLVIEENKKFKGDK